jgi:hypothetical protein
MKGIRAGLVVSIFSTAIAGIYLFVYLYRWEMHRAIVAGVLFVAGEIAVATTLVLRKIETLRVPARAPVDGTSASGIRPEPPPSTGTQESTAQRHFRWLGMDRMNVFIPVLLGANIVVSGIAWLVEHLARSAPAKGRGRTVERDLATLALPLGGFFELPSGNKAIDDDATPGGLSRVLKPVGMLLLISLVIALLALALSGRSRPDANTTGLRSNVVITLDTRNGLDRDLAALSLFEACHTLIENQRLVELTQLETGRYLMVLEPALGEQARRRFFGCLDDGVLERVNADLHGHTITHVEG